MMDTAESKTSSSSRAYDALVLDKRDFVATAIADLDPKGVVRVAWPDGTVQKHTLPQPIPFGHKFAIVAIEGGQHILKYGESVGRARTDIAAGEHVHVHNVDSQRGRGDLA
jgi:altronate dehydratase small subunit